MIRVRVHVDCLTAELEAADALADLFTGRERTFRDRGDADGGGLRVVQQRGLPFVYAPNRPRHLQVAEVVIAYQYVERPRAELEILEVRLLPRVRLARDEDTRRSFRRQRVVGDGPADLYGFLRQALAGLLQRVAFRTEHAIARE